MRYAIKIFEIKIYLDLKIFKIILNLLAKRNQKKKGYWSICLEAM